MTQSGLRLRDIKKSYGRLAVIHGVDLDIEPGEFVVFVGPSGCGKTTLLRMIAGLEDISSGDLSIGGQVVNELPPSERGVAMVFQSYALYPHKTVYDNMAFGLKIAKVPKDEIQRRVHEAAGILQLTDYLQRLPKALSGGQRQRVAIGRAIVRQPQVFLFDEPLSNLDAQLRHEMRVEIKRLHQRLGATIIYVTHDQVEAMTLADRIAVLQAGRLMQYDTPDAIYNQPAATFVAGFTGAPPMNLSPCTVADGAAQLGGLRLPLPAALAARAAPGQALQVGVRPENLRLARGHDDDLEIPAQVQLTEPLGAETLATLACGNTEWVARLPAQFREPHGTNLTLHVRPGHLHLFDAASGNALRA